jgi:hypothetical protein
MIKMHNDMFQKACMLLGMAAFIFALMPDSVYAEGVGESSKSDDNWHYSPREIHDLKVSYPNADAVILRHAVNIEMDKKGLFTRRVARRVALFTDNAIRRYADPRILYDSGTQELEINVSRVYMRDGTTADSGPNAFNQSTPFAFSHAPDYTDWQVMVVTHVGIEKDCVAELVYTIRDKTQRRPWLSGVEHLSHADPALITELTITLPPDQRMKYSCVNGVSAPISTSADQYHWKLENAECIPPINGGVWRGDYLPTIVFSTAKDWDEVSNHIAREFEACSHLQELPGEVNESPQNEDSILELHKESMNRVRTVDAPFGLFESPARNADQIYQSAYAHELDRAVLLSANLKARGIEAKPTLVSAGRHWPDDVPAPESCERILLEVVPADSKQVLWLDPLQEYLCDAEASYAGRTLVRCAEKAEITHMAESGAEENKSSLDVTLTLNEEGKLTGEGSVIMQGAFSPYYSVRGMKDETEKFIRGKVEGLFPEAKLESWNIRTLTSDRVELGFLFKAELPEANENNRIYLTMPKPFSEEVSRIDRVRVERSEYPVPIRVVPCHMNVSLNFTNLESFSLFGDAVHINNNNSVGRATTSKNTNPENEASKITLTKNLIITKEIIPSEEYGQLRSLLLQYGEGSIILLSEGSD